MTITGREANLLLYALDAYCDTDHKGRNKDILGFSTFGGREKFDHNLLTSFTLDGKRTPVLENMPGPGNYHTNMVTFGPDGWLYMSQGAMTNTGIIGLDAY